MSNSADDQSTSSVGIFWGFKNNDGFALAVDATPLSEAEPYGQFLTHPRGHYEVWEGWRSLGMAGLKKVGLPILIISSEYETVPRGRIVFDTTQDLYIIYADAKLQTRRTIEAIARRFGLVDRRTSVRSDSHYIS